MTYRLIIRPAALEDIEQIGEWIGGDNARAGRRFLQNAVTAARDLRRFPFLAPNAGLTEPRIQDLRRRFVPGFRSYLIFYRVTEEVVEVVRVLHGMRDLSPVLLEEPPAPDK